MVDIAAKLGSSFVEDVLIETMMMKCRLCR